MSRRNVLRLSVGVLVTLLVLGAGGFALYVSDYAHPMPEALAALQSDGSVQFSNQNGWLVFQPVNQAITPQFKTGLIIYPGGKVDFRAYAPTARAIAEQGFLVVVPPMPFNLAIFDMNVAQTVINAFPQVQHWAIAGHSLGGVAASGYAAAHPRQIEGIVFWASYPAGDLKSYPGKVVSISGSEDGLTTPAKIADSKANLPASTEYIVIAGGDHAQFGYYGAQPGDFAATIARDEQQKKIVQATVTLVQAISTPQ